MPPVMYDEILARVEHRIQKQYTWFHKPLPPGLKLSTTLRHLASGAKYADMQFAWRVPENTLSVVVQEVCQAICDEYAAEVMTPRTTPMQWGTFADSFMKGWNFPHTYAAIDGKHVAIRKPPKSGTLYYNYKGFFSVILLAMVDHEVAPPRYRRRNPLLATFPCRQLVRWLPSDLVAYCRVPARDRHSLPSQRPIFVLRLRSQPQPFVCCR